MVLWESVATKHAMMLPYSWFSSPDTNQKSWRCIFTSKCWSLTTTRSKVETEFATVRFTAVCNVARENTSTTT
jgi:hypothetical protein